MATAPDERIATTLISRLETVTVDEPDGVVPVTVYRVNRDATDWKPKNNSIVLKQGETSRLPDLDCPGNPPAMAYEIQFGVACFVRQSDRASNADMERVNNLSALARKAITNSTTWYAIDSVSFDAEVGETVPFMEADGGHVGAIFQVTARYRVSELDPFVVR